jgi:caffeoyl-CoA O-methyltransferase
MFAEAAAACPPVPPLGIVPSMADDKFTALTPALYAYLLEHNPPEDDVLRDLARETAALGPIALMQVAREQGALLTLLTRILGAGRALEIGTFTGYSSICIARGLAPGGRLVCCDVSEEWTAIARRYWARAGLDDRIELRLGPALETLPALPADPPLDLVFIDADKPSYQAYYEAVLPRLAPNGLVVFDNVLWMGTVADPTNTDASTVAIRALNDYVAADPRVDAVMLPIADGITIVRRR